MDGDGTSFVLNLRLPGQYLETESDLHYNYFRSELPAGLTLAGVGWLTVNSASSNHDDAFRVLKLVYASMVRALEGKAIWLIAGLSAWQLDTRIVRYRKFWGAMKARGVDTQDLLPPAEQMLERDGKLRFYGGAQLSESTLKTAVNVLLEERCGYLAVIPPRLDIQEVLSIGWTGCLTRDCALVVSFSQAGGALITRVGEFDDRERGFVLIGLSDLVSAFLEVTPRDAGPC